MLKNIPRINLVKTKMELEQVLRIREIVFIKGQKVPENRERDGLDKTSKHAIVFYKNRPISCARVRFVHDRAKLERIALLKNYRGKGFGKLIMQYLIRYCKRKKSKEIVMHAQYYLKGYYYKFGFKIRGKVFMDAGIKHIEMYMKNQKE